MSVPLHHPANFPRSGYSDAEREFLLAMERYKREAHRPFPCWHEVLRVLIGLGYQKVENADKVTVGDKETRRQGDKEIAS